MRGKDGAAVKKEIKKRITPAYAGKSSRSQNSRLERRDHPRLCGEKQQMQQLGDLSEGSPPPMRGKALETYPSAVQFEDHPRLCGEKTKKIPKQRYFFHQPASFSFSLQYT